MKTVAVFSPTRVAGGYFILAREQIESFVLGLQRSKYEQNKTRTSFHH